ncbi:MAG: response regulator transcription factor [bacterium]
MTTGDALERGRAAFESRQWRAAYAQLSVADAERPLEPDDLERLAAAAHLIGEDASVGAIWARAHQGFLEAGDVPRAARCAFWLALPLILRGGRAQGGGWIARATRMLDEGQHDCVERGYLLVGNALRCAMEGDGESASDHFAEAVSVGQRFGDTDLIALARHGHGRALISLGRVSAGAALLDEVMAAITAGDVSPMLVGDVYCSVISACHEMLDIRRAQEWTAALTELCDRQPDLAYRGECLVHRAEILQLLGAWPSATAEAARALECLSAPPPHRAIGPAFYQVGELHRLRGEFALAEDSYRHANQARYDPQPGFSLLRLAQGQLEAARSMIARAMDEPALRRRRSLILPAFVEIALAANDISGARSAADELLQMATNDGSEFLRALTAYAHGAVLLAGGNARAALVALRRASSLWAGLDARYNAARTRALIGLACRALGDADSGALELDAARDQLEALGAIPDVAWVDTLAASQSHSVSHGSASGLTSREVEVLRLVATGKTNRAIAEALGISEKTVARHVSNIFSKLSLTSRAAATAYAYEHELLAQRT